MRDLPGAKYLFYDDDAAGDKGIKTAGPLLKEYAPTFEVFYPEIWIEDPKEPDGGHWLKDPGELEAGEIEEMIGQAKLII